MKYLFSQFASLMHASQRGRNLGLLLRFMLLLVCFFVLYSVLFHVLMEREGRAFSWVTGFYWTLTVMSTLGFGDITFTSDLGRIFSVIVLLTGIIFLLVMLPFTFIQFFYAPWLEAQNRARAPRAAPEGLSGHVILTHFDGVAVALAERLAQYGIPCVVLVADLPRALELFDRGYQVVVGELDDPATYRRLRLPQAAMVAVLNDDVTSTNIIFTVREIDDRVATVTNADQDDSLDILQLAGSTHVFQFTKLLGQALARRVLGGSLRANVIGGFDQLLIAEAPVMGTPLQGRTLAASRLRERAGVTVVGIWEQGVFSMPRPDTSLGAATVLVLAGTADQLERYDHLALPGDRDLPQSGPVLVLGGGRVGQAVAATLAQRGLDYRVVEKRPTAALRGEKVVTGSAADLETLQRAGLDSAPAIIITTHDDDLNIYLTIYCRRLRPEAQIISRASLDRNVNTLHRAGANLVMSYSSLCATTILNLLRPGQLLMLSEGLSVFRADVNHALAGRPLRDNRLRELTGCSVIAIRRGDALLVNPDPALDLHAEDELILVGDEQSEKRFVEHFPAARHEAPVRLAAAHASGSTRDGTAR